MRTQLRSLRWIAVMIGILAPVSSFAETFSFSNIDLTDFDVLVREFSANSAYSSVTPASSLGGLFGFELGVVGGLTKAPDTLALVKRSSPGTSLKDNLYHAGALARLGLPYGLTGEFLLIPKTKISDAKLGRWALALQWTLTDNLLEDLPVNIAVKGYYTKTTVDYSQNINTTVSGVTVPVAANIGLDNNLWGLQSLVSYKVLVFEPWLGIGWTRAKGTLNVDASGTATIFNTTAFGTAAKSAETKLSSIQFLAGVDLRLAFFTLGAEYERVFDRNSYTGRVSFRF